MNENLRRAIDILGSHSRWFQVYDLAGDSRSDARQAVMSALRGVKTPKSKCGVNALKDELYAAAGVPRGCSAHREENFTRFCKGEPMLSESDFDAATAAILGAI